MGMWEFSDCSGWWVRFFYKGNFVDELVKIALLCVPEIFREGG